VAARPRKPRESKAKSTCKLICCTTSPEAIERISESVKDWAPGKWAEENDYGPACTCGLRAWTEREVCQRHGTRDAR
jgi:hypothetical protein